MRLYSYDMVKNNFNSEPLVKTCRGRDRVASCEKTLISEVEHSEQRPKFGDIY